MGVKILPVTAKNHNRPDCMERPCLFFSSTLRGMMIVCLVVRDINVALGLIPLLAIKIRIWQMDRIYLELVI